jgi:hypothetical protein
MGKHESIKDKAAATVAPSGDAAAEAASAGVVDGAMAADTPKMALASLDTPRIDVAAMDIPAIEAPKIESPSIALTGPGAPDLEPPNFDPPQFDMPDVESSGPRPEDFEPVRSAYADDAAAAHMPQPDASARSNRFPLLAASLAVAAGLGAMVGGLVATSVVRSAPPAVVASKSGLEDVQALKEQVVQVRVDLAALKASIDAGHRNANAAFTRIGERVDRIDRTQSEPIAKLTKAIEGFERRDATGSITSPQPIAGAGQPAKQPGSVEGWVLRDVQRGTALIEGRMGVIEVDQGDVVPGLGRIEAIRKQDGRWVVVTSKGLILPPAR